MTDLKKRLRGFEKSKRGCTFLRTAIGKASNSSSVVPNPVMSFMFFLNRPAEGRLCDECGRSNVNVRL